MRGILYGVSVGPGDPELMTLKACRIIREADVIAFPVTRVPGGQADQGTLEAISAPGGIPCISSAGASSGSESRAGSHFEEVSQSSLALRIAAGAVPEIQEKELEAFHFPMTRDKEALARAHKKAAEALEKILDEGKCVAFLTLGDVTVYSTFFYAARIVESDGYQVKLVSGVTSFCAAATELGSPLVLGDEPLVVTTASRFLTQAAETQGTLVRTLVLMKAGPKLDKIKEKLAEEGMQASLIENCGLEGEKRYNSLAEMPDKAGYFSIVIVRG